ncbi:MAG: PKD domain-containing protein, partial [Candidatus Cloacimonetes bacterium]|nr:PKD domain-containing protein [Candidatus Cloacimonadota bacterium]
TYDFTTDYTSAGLYLVTLDVTDNFTDNSIYYEWNVTVNDVDQEIVVTDIQPTPGPVTIDEMETINFFIDAYDPDGNPLEYSWKLDGVEESTSSAYDFTTDYTSAGLYLVTLDVTDNFSDNSLYYEWNVTVNDVDQNIVVNNIQPPPGPITIDETETINFFIDAYDPDGNPLEYSWKLDGVEESTVSTYDFTTDYTSAGLYLVTLDVTDNFSDNSLYYEWNVTVNDVDQPIVVNNIQPPPGPVTINETETINFFIDAYDPDGNPLEYSWKLDGVEVSTISTYDFITDYTSAGLYLVTLDVTDNFTDNSIYYEWNVTVNDVDQNIVVNNIQPPPGPVTINETETINFFIDAYDPDGNPLEYSWKLDGVEESTVSTYNFITDYTSAGLYLVSLDVTDNFSDNSLYYEWNVTVNDVDQEIVVTDIQPAPGPVTIDEMETINFFIDAYDPDGNPLEYSWKLDGNEVSTISTYDFITDYTSAGLYLVTLDVTDNFTDNSIYYEWNVTVNDVDQEIVVNDIQPPPGPVTIDETETINFFIDAYDPDGNPLEYSWKLDGVEESTVSTYDFTTDYTSAGLYLVTLDVTDNFTDNSLYYEWNVTVNDVDQEIVVNDIQPTPGPVTIDEMDTIDFYFSGYDPDGNPLEFSWQLDGVEVSTDSTYIFETDYTSAGEYVVTLEVTDNFGTRRISSVSRNTLNYSWDVTVDDVDQPIVVNELIPPEGDITIDEGDVINFSIDAYDPDGNNLEYSWQVEGVEVSTTNSFDFITDENSAGEYEVTLFVTDNFGTRDELNFLWNVTVNDVSGSGEVLIPVITKLFQNHPNPFNPLTNIQFDIKENEMGVLSIFNLKGQIIESQRFNDGIHNYSWNAENQSSGVYFYKLQTESFTEIRKMILLK